MDDQTQANLDASVQDVDTSVDNDTNDTYEGDNNAYLNQKKRAEKAEAEKKALEARLKELEASKGESVAPQVQSSLTEDEIFVISKLQDKEKLEHLRKIAKIENISLIEALDNDLYKLWEQKREQEKKSEEAQLGASRGSGTRKAQKTLTTPGLTTDEHKELWRKMTGK